jgi:ATP synthase protein I
MAADQRGSERISGTEVGWAIISTLIAGMLVLGGAGYLVDRLVGTDKVFAAVGIVLGAAVGIYTVYLRYGKDERDHR